MTDQWKGIVLGKMLNQILPGCLVSTNKYDVWIENENLLEVCNVLREKQEFKFDLLNSITAVDYIDYFEHQIYIDLCGKI